MNKPIFIAEIKPFSPFGFQSKKPWTDLAGLAIERGDWISVHTNPKFGGSMHFLEIIRKKTDKPILAKGYHKTDEEINTALKIGANYVLVVDRLPAEKYLDKILIECSDFRTYSELTRLAPQCKFVHNLRDLRRDIGLLKKHNDFMEYKRLHGDSIWLCQASGIRDKADVNPSANAFIVGEKLVEFCKSL